MLSHGNYFIMKNFTFIFVKHPEKIVRLSDSVDDAKNTVADLRVLQDIGQMTSIPTIPFFTL